jgi:uncharacterized membrane protein (DUF2068 family)
MLRLIAAFKLLKGLLLLAVATRLFRVLHEPDVADALRAWAIGLHLNPASRHVGRLLERLGAVDESTLRRISVGAFVYAALLLTEGVGLMLRQRWAEYFTVIITTSFIPIEAYEAFRHLTPLRVMALVINVAIVWYLVSRLKRHRAY